MTTSILEPVFGTYIPTDLEPGRLYISMEYSTAVHLCACGCGDKVVTPFGPADWQIAFDGTVTLRPSIGNGQLPCRSHYLVRANRIDWLRPISATATKAALANDHVVLKKHHERPHHLARFWNWATRWLRSPGGEE